MLLRVLTFGVDLSNRLAADDALFLSICQRPHLHHVRISGVCHHFIYKVASCVHFYLESQAFVSSVSGMVLLVDLDETRWVSHYLANQMMMWRHL